MIDSVLAYCVGHNTPFAPGHSTQDIIESLKNGYWKYSIGLLPATLNEIRTNGGSS